MHAEVADTGSADATNRGNDSGSPRWCHTHPGPTEEGCSTSQGQPPADNVAKDRKPWGTF